MTPGDWIALFGIMLTVLTTATVAALWIASRIDRLDKSLTGRILVLETKMNLVLSDAQVGQSARRALRFGNGGDTA